MRGRFLGAALVFALAVGCASAPRPVGKTQLPGCPPAWVSTPDDAYAAAFRSRIGAVWDPEISQRASRYHGENSDRYTILIADINPDGGLAAVHVEQRSTIGFFDDAVMAAMRRADPFPAPPPSLIGSEGVARIRFGIYLGSGAFGAGTCGSAAPGSPAAAPATGAGAAPASDSSADSFPQGRRQAGASPE